MEEEENEERWYVSRIAVFTAQPELILVRLDGKKNGAIEDELEQVGGTTEDDIGDTITHIRERELLGPGSLLGRFGPLLTEICIRNKIYTVSIKISVFLPRSSI